MTKKELGRLAKRFVTGLPGFSVRGPLLFMQPLGHTIVAYAFARNGDVPQAIRALDHLLELLAGGDRAWVRQMFDQAAALKAVLLKQPSEAQRQLSVWEDQTAKALGLERFRDNAAAPPGSR